MGKIYFFKIISIINQKENNNLSFNAFFTYFFETLIIKYDNGLKIKRLYDINKKEIHIK